MTSRLATALTVLATAFLVGCGKDADPNEPSGFVQIKGSDTIVNAIQKTSEEFMKEYPYVFVAVTGGGSGVGIASLINRTCDLASTSREMKVKEIELARKHGVDPCEIVVAFDGVAVIVNRANPVDRLAIQDLYRIFTGKAKRWTEFGGKDLPIVTLSREVSSGTHAYFKDEVIHLGKKDSQEEFSPQTLLLSSSQAIVEEVVTNESAVGYLGMGYVSDRTKAILVAKTDQFYPPDVAHVLAGTYPLARGLYLYANGAPRGAAKLFVDFALSDRGQQQFVDTGFVPIRPIGVDRGQTNH